MYDIQKNNKTDIQKINEENSKTNFINLSNLKQTHTTQVDYLET